MEEVHHLFCAHLINIFSFFRAVELRHFFHQKYRGGVRFVQSVIQTDFIPLYSNFAYYMIVHTLKMCTGDAGPEQILVLLY